MANLRRPTSKVIRVRADNHQKVVKVAEKYGASQTDAVDALLDYFLRPCNSGMHKFIFQSFAERQKTKREEIAALAEEAKKNSNGLPDWLNG